MRRSVLPALSLVLALTACGFSDTPDGDADGSSSAPPAGTSAAGPGPDDTGVAVNERGNVPMNLGEDAPIRPSTEPGGPPLVTLSLDQVDVDPVCDDDSEVPPDNGHYVALLLRAEATSEFDPRVLTPITISDFTVIGPDGSTYPTASEAGMDCFGPPRLIQNMRIGPGNEYAGWMVLDVPVASGTLVYAPGDGPHGWEWQF